MSNFLRVMDGLKSNAGGFEYKLDEINKLGNFTEEELEITYKFLLCCNIVIMSKYPHICEVLDLANKDKEYENKTINSFCSKLYLGQIDLDNITPENLFELIRFSDALASPLNVFRKMYLILFDNESLACQTMINAFKMHKYGYDAYKVLLREHSFVVQLMYIIVEQKNNGIV